MIGELDQHRRHLEIECGLGRVDSVAHSGHPVIARQSRNENLAVRSHLLEKVGPFVQVHTVLDGVHPMGDRRLASGQSLGVCGHLEPHAVGLVYQRRELGVGELEGLGVLQLVRTSARRHHLDEVGPGADLLADSAAQVVRAVRLPVHVAIEAAARRSGRNDLPAGENRGPRKAP